MRFVVAYEGVPTKWSMDVFEPGSLEPDSDHVSVMSSGNWSNVMGTARDFQRSEDGKISFDITSPLGNENLFEYSIYVNNVVAVGKDEYGNRKIVKAIIRALYATPKAAIRSA